MLAGMSDPFEVIDAVYQSVGRDLFGRDDLHVAVGEREPDEAGFFALVLVGSEVDNGGFAQLFTNSTGDVVPQAIAGAERFGLTEHARLLRDAGNEFFPDGLPTDQPTRLRQWETISEDPSIDERLEQLDERWYDPPTSSNSGSTATPRHGP
jgi:hypothetical protein